MQVWRLRPGGEFERVRQHGRSWPHRLLVIIVQPRSGAPHEPPRIGVAAGKRLGTAVVRNRLKRHLREAIRSVYPNITYGIDLIAIARAPMVEAGVADITTALIEVLHRAGVWRESSAGSNEA